MSDTADRKIVALLENPAAAGPCLTCVTQAAGHCGATPRLLHVGSDPQGTDMPPEERDMRILRDIERGTSPEKRRAAIEKAFAEWQAAHAQHAGLTLEDDEGDVARIVASDTDLADLVILARPATLDGEDALRGALFRARRLVLVVPETTSNGDRDLFDHVVIGWKPGASAERMLSAAAPWLRLAKTLTLISVLPEGRASYLPAARKALEALSLQAEYVERPKADDSVGNTLLAEARSRDATCLAIGAYHHGEMWENLLGGVTRDVMDGTDIPTLMMR